MSATEPGGARLEPRTECKIKATARYLGRTSSAAVLDLSPEGIRIYLRTDIGLNVGSRVSVETEEVGRLSGEVRWIRFPYVGLVLAPSSNTTAKLDSYFKVAR